MAAMNIKPPAWIKVRPREFEDSDSGDGGRATTSGRRLAGSAQPKAGSGSTRRKGGKDVLERLVSTMGQLTLVSAADIRSLHSATYLTYLIPALSSLATAGTEAGTMYNKAIADRKKALEELGSVKRLLV